MPELTPDPPTNRDAVRVDDLRLPAAAIPRAGDAVTWYLNASRQEGWLSGHTPGAKPFVRNKNGYTFPLASFDELRWKDPALRIGPAWHNLGPTAAIVRPTRTEYAEFGRLLSQPIPPGPTYMELIEEIWYRGFEIFLIGGTVRDVLSGNPTNDVDLVTTMPLERAAPLLQSMYRKEPSVHGPNGYVRLGGTPASGDPFIDLKSFVLADPGTEQVVFAGDFAADVRHRDFACNCVYYDPINNVLIDPTGRGIEDAAGRLLEVVCDPSRPLFHRAQIIVRFLKFRCRGYTASEATLQFMQQVFLPGLNAMPRSELIAYVHRQIFQKTPAAEHSALVSVLELVVCETCGINIWQSMFAPLVDHWLFEDLL